MSEAFVTYWKHRQALRLQQNRRAAKLARRDLDKILQVLCERYGVQRIVLFGSLAKGQFTQESDIDLAVAGLASKDFFIAYAEIDQLSQFKVDLKPLENLHSHFYHRVLTQGEVLYEASDTS